MQIKSLAITNLRSHRSTLLKGFDRVNLFIGQNFSGKSTILDALCYAFKGVCRGIDEGGRGGEAVISTDGNGRPLAKSFTVVAETSHGTITRNGPGEGPRSNVQKLVDGIFAKAAQRFVDPRILVESTRFLDMAPNEQKAVLQQLTGAEVARDRVVAYLRDDFGPIEALWPAELATAPLSTLDTIEKYVREQRRLAKRDADFLRPADLSAYTQKATPDGKELRQLTADEADAMAGRIKVRLDSLKAQVQQAAGGLDREMARLAELDADVESLTLRAAQAPPGASEYDKEIAETKAELTKRQNELQALVNGMHGAGDAQARIAELKKGGDKCWVCQRALDAKQRAKIVTTLEKEIGASQESLGRRTKLKSEIAALEGWIVDASTRKAQHAAAVTAHSEAKKQLETAMQKQKAQRELVAGMQKEAPSVPADVPERITKGEQKLIDTRAYVQARRLYERQEKVMAAASARLESMERLCQAFGPGSPIRSEMVTRGSSDFGQAVSEAATGFSLDLVIEPDPFRLLSRGRDIALLSTSQRLRLGFAVQVAVSRATGLGFVCVDNLDWLDTAGRTAMSAAVAQMPEQIFVCATNKIPDEKYVRPNPAENPGWKFYLVRGDGDVSKVEEL